MRIAFFVGAFPVLSETFILNQITGLLDRGHEVDIYASTPHRATNHPAHPEVFRYRLLERTRYLNHPRNYMLRVLKAISLIVSRPGWLRPEGMLLALRILNHRRRVGARSFLSLLYVSTPQVSGKQYDVIHCQYGPYGGWVMHLRQIGAITGKLVTSFRGHDATQWRYTDSGIYKELFRDGDLFLPVSEDLKQRVVQMGCDERKIQVLHSGIDCSKFEYCERRIDKGEPIRLITVARLVEMKGVEYAIRAVARLITSGRDIRYSIIGDGVLRNDLERLIGSLGVSKQIRLVGWRNHTQLVDLLQDAHVLVAPSVTAETGETEGIPNAVKEAMALGLPVVSTHHGGIPELVEDRVAGFLVPERDVDALADRLAYLCDHAEIWPKMGRAARTRVESEFDNNRLSDRLVELYASLISQPVGT